MKLTGKWACLALYDCSMDIMEDGKVYLSFRKKGDYNLQPEVTVTDGGLHWKTDTMSCTLDLANEKLSGTFTEEGEEPMEVTFVSVPGVPVGGKFHHHNYGGAETVPADFPLTAGQLHGKWTSPVPFPFDMNFFAEGDKVTIICFSPTGGGPAFFPFDVCFEDGSLIWQINDANNRGRCPLRLVDGNLLGTYTQPHHDTLEFSFKKVSDTPEKPEPLVALPEGKSRLEILREYAAYEEKQEPVETEYRLREPVPEIFEKYEYRSYLEGKTGDDVAFACLDFICDHFHHYGRSGIPPYQTRRVEDFVKYCAKHENKTNCRGLSIMLAGVLRFNGIRAQHVTCMPFEMPCNDCHVVVDCFLPSGRRIMLDPTYRLWLYDDKGEYVSLPRLREILIEGGSLTPCDIASYTGGEGFDIDYYRDYMSKNTVYFSKGRINEDGNDEREKMLLFPAEYPWEKVSSRKNAEILFDPNAFWGKDQ